ncbi:hypothetical protein GH890_29840 [Bacillus thuringiensis]|nr:hypothetical protein [Bacillus thuringiensis]
MGVNIVTPSRDIAVTIGAVKVIQCTHPVRYLLLLTNRELLAICWKDGVS